MSSPRDLALEARAWPFEEARKLLTRPDTAGKGYVLFETGYGPSGLPHIGTFGEVARTSMVRHAFETLSDVPTRLICFSDDMDGLRKVPSNVPNQDLLAAHLDQPLTAVPDPFGKFDSFGAHNNAMLRSFLDRFGFSYEFKSATECYRSGLFDKTLLRVLAHYDAIMDVMLPSLREERQKTYSPFLPLCPRTGRVLQVPVVARDVAAGTITYEEEGRRTEVPVTGGHCKLQWKADWAMRWVALGIDYEMAGKDLIPSVQLSSKIARILGAAPPDGFNYELFLDEKGEKISKSKGNGLSIEDWLRYATPESLSLFMFQKPRTAKRLYFDTIPKTMDEYVSHLEAYAGQGEAERLENPAWHIHDGKPPREDVPVSFGMLLNLVSASSAQDRAVLWGFIRNYAPGASPETHPLLDRLIGHALRYFEDFVRPAKRYRVPTDKERRALHDLADALESTAPDSDAESLQNIVYEIGKSHQFEPLRDWFKAIYEVLFGESQGPRFGSFVALYGIAESVGLIHGALARSAEEA
jgi:lysyl-tRNA synthetase, class I